MKSVLVVPLALLALPAVQGFFFGITYTDICDHLCRCPKSMLEARDQALDCRDRNITTLKENLMFPRETLRIDFSRNRIQNISKDTFNDDETLIGIDFSENDLEILPEWTFEQLPHLRELSFKNNRIHTIDVKAFLGLGNLTKLDLSYNDLTSLPEKVFSYVPKLEELILNFNPLRDLSGISLAQNIALRTLHLSSLGIQTIHHNFFPANLTRLTKITLAFNEMTAIPSKALFHVRDSLTDLDFSGNPIKNIGAYAFFKLSNLKNLRLDQMLRLERIEAYALGDLTHLETCTIRYMPRISHLDPKAFYNNFNGTSKPIKIEDFTFSFSILSTLPEHLLNWSELRQVNLQYNKWNCDCNMKWIKNSTLLQRTGKKMICSTPPNLHARRIVNIPAEKFSCLHTEVPKNESLGIIIGLLIAGIGISLATIAILVYWRQGWLFTRPQGNYHNIERGASEITVVDNIGME